MDAEQLVERLENRLDCVVDGLDDMGVPSDQLVLSPCSAELALRARADGRAFYHDELRGFLPVPPSLAPELTVWEENGTVPVWNDGILEAPKYFSFFMDTVFAPYTPNHRKKWRIHEVMHSLCRFYWNPKMTRFSCYVGSRLSELLPVVHWYGLDEIFRNRCPKHQGARLYREYCVDCERIAQPYWHLSEEQRTELHPFAEQHARHAFDHYASEMKACLTEIETGQRVVVHRPKLDASSDAVGYLRGHWNRLTAWSFGRFIELFMSDGADYFLDLHQCYEHQQRVWKEIVEGHLPSQEASLRKRDVRVLQDVGYRSLMMLEWCADEDCEQALMPLIEHAAQQVEKLRGEDLGAVDVRQTIERILSAVKLFEDRFPERVFKAFPMLGYPWFEGYKSERFVTEGLSSALHESIQNLSLASCANRFIRSDYFEHSRPLRARFADWAKKELPQDTSEPIELESWLRAVPHVDEEAELFASLPEEEWGRGELRLHKTFRRSRFSARAINQVLGWGVEQDELDLIAIWSSDGPQVFQLEPEHAELLAVVSQGRLPDLQQHRAQIDALLSVGVLIWLPI